MGRKASDRVESPSQLVELRRYITDLEAALVDFEKARQQLSEDQSFRRAIIEKAAEGVCVCHEVKDHPHVQFTVWNAQMTKLTGYTLEEINRKGWYQTLYPDAEVQKRARERMERMRSGDDLLNERWEIRRADGEKRMISISTSVLMTNDGVTHVLALMHDVTLEEQQRQFLEARVRNLEQLLPICSWCKKIRDNEGDWHPVESYVAKHYDASFTHGICPECKNEIDAGINI